MKGAKKEDFMTGIKEYDEYFEEILNQSILRRAMSRLFYHIGRLFPLWVHSLVFVLKEKKYLTKNELYSLAQKKDKKYMFFRKSWGCGMWVKIDWNYNSKCWRRIKNFSNFHAFGVRPDFADSEDVAKKMAYLPRRI